MHVNVWTVLHTHAPCTRWCEENELWARLKQVKVEKNTKTNEEKEKEPTKISRHRHHYSFHPICCAFDWTDVHTKKTRTTDRSIGHFVWVRAHTLLIHNTSEPAIRTANSNALKIHRENEVETRNQDFSIIVMFFYPHLFRFMLLDGLCFLCTVFFNPFTMLSTTDAAAAATTQRSNDVNIKKINGSIKNVCVRWW